MDIKGKNMRSIHLFLLLFVITTTVLVIADSQEIADQLNRARMLPQGSQQLNIVLDILRPSSGASASQRKEAESFPVFKERQAYWSGR